MFWKYLNPRGKSASTIGLNTCKIISWGIFRCYLMIHICFYSLILKYKRQSSYMTCLRPGPTYNIETWIMNQKTTKHRRLLLERYEAKQRHKKDILDRRRGNMGSERATRMERRLQENGCLQNSEMSDH